MRSGHVVSSGLSTWSPVGRAANTDHFFKGLGREGWVRAEDSCWVQVEGWCRERTWTHRAAWMSRAKEPAPGQGVDAGVKLGLGPGGRPEEGWASLLPPGGGAGAA